MRGIYIGLPSVIERNYDLMARQEGEDKKIAVSLLLYIKFFSNINIS